MTTPGAGPSEPESPTMLRHMGPMPGGGWGMELEGGPIPAIAEYLANMLGMKAENPSNYVQMEVNRGLDRMVLILQRCAGKTPHQLRLEAEAERDQAAAKIRRLSGLVGEAASLVYRIEAAGHLPYEVENFLRWKEAARELGPKLRATLAEMGEG